MDFQRDVGGVFDYLSEKAKEHGLKMVNAMLDRAGIYVVISHGRMICFVEVDASRRAFQLNARTFERDGELMMDDWRLEAITSIHGPMEMKK